jgi:hypothetical protein
MSTLKLREFGDFLGSRHLGHDIRERLTALLLRGEDVVVDFDGVSMVTQSFADEAFGKLARDVGVEPFCKHVTLQSVTPDVAPLLRHVLARRAPHFVIPK